MVFVPGGTPHAFRSVGPETGRQLILSTPGRLFEAFIEEVENAMVDSGKPSDNRPAVDFRAIAARHGIEFVDAPRTV